jgi:hypothetical protein
MADLANSPVFVRFPTSLSQVRQKVATVERTTADPEKTPLRCGLSGIRTSLAPKLGAQNRPLSSHPKRWHEICLAVGKRINELAMNAFNQALEIRIAKSLLTTCTRESAR